MGPCSSGDECNRPAEAAFVALANTVRVVDDLLRFDRTFTLHVVGVCAILKAARDAGFQFSSASKNSILPRILYSGLDSTSSMDALPSRSQLKTLAHFPRPMNIIELRSFMGLGEQLTGFSTEVAIATPQHKNPYIWMVDYDQAFEAVKRALVSPPPPVLVHFDPARETTIHCRNADALRRRAS